MTTCVCVASGPSLTLAQTELIEAARAAGRCHVIVVNTTWEKLPNADVLYAADGRWWDKYHAQLLDGFKGECWTPNAEASSKYGLCFIAIEDRAGMSVGLSRDPTKLRHNGNGGAQSVNLAYHFGARKIVLVGFDMQAGPNGELHHHPDHPAGLGNTAPPARWIDNFDALAADLQSEGVELINCSLRTALRVRRGDLAEALAGP
jgi:hypothetical protein